MPAYNQGKYIDEALESLKNQTFQDFVVHIVDDGSDDNYTYNKLKSIKYDKAELFLNTGNKGVAYRARQHYKKLNTKYVMVLCADDKLDPRYLEKTVGYMESHEKCGIVSTNFFLWKDGKNIPCKLNGEKMVLKYMLSRCYCFGSALMRKKALDEADLSGGFTRYQDWDRYVAIMKNGWEASLISEPLFYYRQHGDSLSHSATVEEEMEVKRRMVKKYADLYQKYYKEVILDIYNDLLEVQKGKDWLDGQYHNHLKEIERLNREIEILNNKLKKMPGSIIKRAIRKVGRILRGGE